MNSSLNRSKLDFLKYIYQKEIFPKYQFVLFRGIHSKRLVTQTQAALEIQKSNLGLRKYHDFLKYVCKDVSCFSIAFLIE